MKTAFALRASAIGLLIAALTFASQTGETCTACLTPELSPKVTTSDAQPAEVGHPLRGVILELMPEKQALLVNHEEIPGFMSAMTMLLKVDATALAAAKKGQTITATLVRKADGWWIENVRPIAADTAAAL